MKHVRSLLSGYAFPISTSAPEAIERFENLNQSLCNRVMEEILESRCFAVYQLRVKVQDLLAKDNLVVIQDRMANE